MIKRCLFFFNILFISFFVGDCITCKKGSFSTSLAIKDDRNSLDFDLVECNDTCIFSTLNFEIKPNNFLGKPICYNTLHA